MEDLDKLVRDTRELVRIDSRDPAGEAKVREWTELQLNRAPRLQSSRFVVSEGRQNLQILLPGRGAGGRLILLAHMDTVPVSGAWRTDPWGATVSDGHIWGLGSADMKSGLAVALNVLIDLARDRSFVPSQDLILWLTVDEETAAMPGASYIAREGLIGLDDSVLALEPTGLRLRSAQVGVRWMVLRVSGRSAHAGRRHLGADANLALAHLLVQTYQMIRQLPYDDPDLGAVLFNPGRLAGGEAANVVSGAAHAIVDFRLVPPADDELVLSIVRRAADEVSALFSNIHVDIDLLGPPRPPNRVDPGCTLVRALTHAYQTVTGTAIESGGDDGHEAYTDASMIAAITGNRNCTVFGPGSSDFAHVPDERVPIADLAIAYDTVEELCRRWPR